VLVVGAVPVAQTLAELAQTFAELAWRFAELLRGEDLEMARDSCGHYVLTITAYYHMYMYVHV